MFNENQQLLDSPPFLPAQDPPAFPLAQVRECQPDEVRVQGSEGKHKILLPTSVPISVNERLLAMCVRTTNNDNDDVGANDNGEGEMEIGIAADDDVDNDDNNAEGGEMEMEDGSYDSDSDSDDSSVSTWEQEMEDDPEVNPMSGAVARSQSSPMIAFCKSGFCLGQVGLLVYLYVEFLLTMENHIFHSFAWTSSLCLQGIHGGYTVTIWHYKVLHKAAPDWINSGQDVAIKTISWDAILATRNRLYEDFVKEIEALQYISQWHKTEGISHTNSHVMGADAIMADQSNVYIVMPCCLERDLCYHVAKQDRQRLTEDDSRKLFIQILKGLETLQQMQICHRDLSPENMVILNDRTLAIDYGMCLRIPYDDRGNRHLLAQQGDPCGKWPHMAPEISMRRKFDGHAVDVWAAGTILYFMLTGKRFRGVHPIYVESHFATLNLDLSDKAMDLLSNMFRTDPGNRLSLNQIRQHPFVCREHV